MESKTKITSDELVVEERIRAVVQWILKGYFTKDILKQGSVSWNITERQMYTYLKKAKKEIRRIRSKEMEDLIAWHQAARLKLFSELDNKKTPSGTFAAMDILKDMAKIDGAYPADKHEFKIDAETTVVVGSKQLSKE